MNIKEFSKLLHTKGKELDKLFRRTMPVIAGNMSVRYYQENFRKSGFVNNGLTPWPKTRRQLCGGKSASSQQKPLLSSRNHLFSSVRSQTADYRVKVLNEVPYAPVHNWGATLTPTVTPKMRRFAWAMYFRASGKSSAQTKGRKSAKKPQPRAANPEADMWRGLALTKKKRLKITIPQRQFIGRSAELETAMHNELEKQVEKLLNL